MMFPWRGSRRRFVVEIGVGFAVGAAAGLGFAAADAWLPHPTVAVIGEKATQLAFLRTADTRIAILTGPWSNKLADALLPLLGWSKRRIELLIVPEGDQSAGATAWVLDRRVVQTMLQVGGDSRHVSGFDWIQHVDRQATLELDSGVRLTVVPQTVVYDALGRISTTLWAVMIQRSSLSIWLLERNTASEWLLGDNSPSLVAIADGSDVATTLSALRPPALALNATSQEIRTQGFVHAARSVSTALVRVFPDEAALFRLDAGRLHLPPWTSLAGSL